MPNKPQLSASTQRGKMLIAFVVGVGLACVVQFAYMVIRLANLSDVPPEILGQVHLTTNLRILASAIAFIFLYGIWNGERRMGYAFCALATANIALSLYAGDGLIALCSVLAILLLMLQGWAHS